MPKKTKNGKRKVKLLPHESDLLAEGKLVDVTHPNASSTWLIAPSTDESTLNESDDDGEGRDDCRGRRILIYRHMGDIEFSHLLQYNQLPSTQPYQTITRSQEGRAYCESYLRSNKYVNTSPTTVIEFICSEAMIDSFYLIQRKPEDGTLSHGLGGKAGKTLPIFNAALESGDITWRIVLVKRARSSTNE